MAATLCFIDAAHVLTPDGGLTGFRVIDALNRNLGKLEGFVLDPGNRRLRFLVVTCQRWLRTRRYLLPLKFVQVDPGTRAMRVDLDNRTSSAQIAFEPSDFPVYSDEHLLEAMFGSGRGVGA
jgi:hypothetical protein